MQHGTFLNTGLTKKSILILVSPFLFRIMLNFYCSKKHQKRYVMEIGKKDHRFGRNN